MADNNEPCGTFRTKDVPTEEVDNVVALYRLDANLKSVTKKKQANGKWTVTAVFPPCVTVKTYAPAAGGAGTG
jgi:hypothetical protein